MIGRLRDDANKMVYFSLSKSFLIDEKWTGSFRTPDGPSAAG